jgi:DNA ligase-1
MTTAKIYKRDTLGKIRFWQAEIDGVNYRTIAGIEGEPTSHVVSGWTRCVGKQGRTSEDQALFEASSDMQKKLAREYRNQIHLVDMKINDWVKPMLAHKYEDWQGPCFSQPKLDGIRCIATSSGLFSREGQPFVAAPHVMWALEPVFAKNPGVVFDGEFYNHDFHDDFNAIVSAVKRTKPSAADLEVSAKLVQYHVYDLPSMAAHSFADRRQAIGDLMGEGLGQGVVQRVETMSCVTPTELDGMYEHYLKENYEGQMVRLNAPYEHKRSKKLLKRKEFRDGEFPVVEVLPGNGNWAGIAKKAVLSLPDGRQFGAGLRGTVAQMKALQAGPKPATATVRYFNLTPDGIPRFPVVTAFHSGGRL